MNLAIVFGFKWLILCFSSDCAHVSDFRYKGTTSRGSTKGLCGFVQGGARIKGNKPQLSVRGQKESIQKKEPQAAQPAAQWI